MTLRASPKPSSRSAAAPALRAEAPGLAESLAFLRDARTLVEPPEPVRVFDPVPNVITRRAGWERAQLVMQSRSRPALQDYLAALTARVFDAAPRAGRWHPDADPIEFD